MNDAKLEAGKRKKKHKSDRLFTRIISINDREQVINCLFIFFIHKKRAQKMNIVPFPNKGDTGFGTENWLTGKFQATFSPPQETKADLAVGAHT